MYTLVDKISVGCAITTFLLFIIYKLYKRQDPVLSDVVIVIMASGMIPSAIAIVLYPFFPSLLPPIESMSLQITIMGLVLLYVWCRTIIKMV